MTGVMSLQRIGVFLDLRLDIYLKSHQEMLPLKLPFFHLWTSPHFNALNHESESTGSQSVYRKLSPHVCIVSKQNCFEIKISQRHDWETPSLFYYDLLVTKNGSTGLEIS